MSIYATGTVSVTAGSATVTGSGTAWQLFLITGGLFSCQGIAIPIQEVVSDTELTLGYAWTGATGAGLAYAVDRQSAAAASAVEANDRLAQIVKRLEALSYVDFDAVGSLAERAAYNEEPKGFKFLDISADPFDLWVKASAASGDWAGPNAYGQGATGDQGPSGTIDVGATTTVAPGQPANVTNTGTNTAAVFDFDIPQGEKGNAGWAVELATEMEGPDRVVLRIEDFIGGEGAKPPGAGQYIGPSGFVATPAEAINIKGVEGSQGPAGTPFKGTWDNGTTYQPNDLVIDVDSSSNPAVWIALTQNTNSQPKDNPADWAFFPGSFPATEDYGLITDGATATNDYGSIV